MVYQRDRATTNTCNEQHQWPCQSAIGKSMHLSASNDDKLLSGTFAAVASVSASGRTFCDT